MQTILVGIGGFIGAVARYWLGNAVQNGRAGVFPLGTLVVNVVGCLAIGALMQLVEVRNTLTPDVRAMLGAGLLGGFTTFSAFANETVNAWRGGDVATATLNVVLSVASCLLAVWLGRALVDALT
jgi:fluoride exporter